VLQLKCKHTRNDMSMQSIQYCESFLIKEILLDYKIESTFPVIKSHCDGCI
jgi:hypothetical protein